MSQDSGMPLSGKATVDALGGQWAKILAIVMFKHKLVDVTITKQDIEALGPDGQMDYCLVPGPGNTPAEIRIRLMRTEEAVAEASKHRGGFGKS